MTGLALPVSRGLRMAHALLAAALMIGCLWAGTRLTPALYRADQVGVPDFETLLPFQFGDWKLNPVRSTMIVDPQKQATVDAIYDKVVERTYVHQPTGRQIMISLAYGRNQSIRLQAHPPEACYRSGGFVVEQLTKWDLPTPFGPIAAMRMESRAGTRFEPVTYWFKVGDQVARGSLDRNLVRMRFAARGYLVDGLLFRVSEITRLPARESFELQDLFVSQLLRALSPEGRIALIGNQAASPGLN